MAIRLPFMGKSGFASLEVAVVTSVLVPVYMASVDVSSYLEKKAMLDGLSYVVSKAIAEADIPNKGASDIWNSASKMVGDSPSLSLSGAVFILRKEDNESMSVLLKCQFQASAVSLPQSDIYKLVVPGEFLAVNVTQYKLTPFFLGSLKGIVSNDYVSITSVSANIVKIDPNKIEC
jgi:hypothetical protein